MPAMKTILTGLALAALGTTAALAAEKAGVSAGVRGEVLRTASQAGQPTGVGYKGGDAVFMGDGIQSKPDAGMQVMLLDQTTFTIGPDSALTIDEFVYDPAAGAGKVGASILKGGFRFVSGKIAANKTTDMVVKTPTATIGVRGTAVFGLVGLTETIIGLAGPGRNNNTGDKVAGVDVFTPNGNAELRRAGFAARIIQGQAPEVIRITPELLLRLEAALASNGPPARGTGTAAPASGGSTSSSGTTSGGSTSSTSSTTSSSSSTSTTSTSSTSSAPDSGSGASASPSGGLGEVATIGTMGGADLGATLQTLQGLQSVSEIVKNTEEENADLAEKKDEPALIGEFDEITTVAQLVGLPAGTGTYAQTAVPLFDANTMNAAGTYDFNLTVSFGSMNYTAQFNNINSATVGVANGSLTFDQMTAPYIDPSIAGASMSGACGSGATCTGTFILVNNGTDIARSAIHGLDITNGSNAVNGGGIAVRP